MRWLITALIVFTLAGCGLVRQAEIRQELEVAKLQMDRDLAECARLYPDRKPPVTPKMKCQAAAMDKRNAAIERSIGNPQRDIRIYEKQKAQVLLAAERFDKGEISEAEFDLELANSNVESETQRLQRTNDAAAVQAAQGQAAAAWSAARPRTTNCNTFGGSTHCTTH